MDAPPPTGVEAASAYRPEGQVHAAYGRGAGVTNSFDRNRVVGPATSLARNAEGRWGGTIGGQAVLLDAGAGRIQGAGVELSVRRDGGALLVSGLWHGARLDLEFRKDLITGTPGGGCSIELRPAQGGTWRGLYACPNPDVAVLELEGAAADVPEVPLPAWLFAFLGTFAVEP
jgi:hypothetical protein